VEGVTFYLPEAGRQGHLHFVRDHAGAASTIAFDYVLSRHPLVNNPRSMFAQWGEPGFSPFQIAGAASYLRQEGLTVVSDTSAPPNICVARVP